MDNPSTLGDFLAELEPMQASYGIVALIKEVRSWTSGVASETPISDVPDEVKDKIRKRIGQLAFAIDANRMIAGSVRVPLARKLRQLKSAYWSSQGIQETDAPTASSPDAKLIFSRVADYQHQVGPVEPGKYCFTITSVAGTEWKLHRGSRVYTYTGALQANVQFDRNDDRVPSEFADRDLHCEITNRPYRELDERKYRARCRRIGQVVTHLKRASPPLSGHSRFIVGDEISANSSEFDTLASHLLGLIASTGSSNRFDALQDVEASLANQPEDLYDYVARSFVSPSEHFVGSVRDGGTRYSR